jgi:hypothetical protein
MRKRPGPRLTGAGLFLLVLRGSTDRVVPGVIGMCVSHTSGNSVLAEGGVTERDFRKRDEEKFAYASL